VGLTRHAVRFLLHCRASGVDFGSSAMIGRQALHLSKAELRSCFAKSGKRMSSEDAERVFTAASGYAEPLFELLGAASVESLDVSDYEEATHVVDFNVALPALFASRYSAVVDSGSLEHVFNYPQGLKNAMEMVRVGGHLILITPTHSLSGHGFYQLSPEVFFRALCERNGYDAPEVLICSTLKDAWYRVADPAVVSARIRLGGKLLTDHLFIVSKRVVSVPIFAEWPQQSDYSAAWSENDDKSGASAFARLRERLRGSRHRIPTPLLRLYQRLMDPKPQKLTRVRL
jgi:hypothetical protein